MAKKKSKDKTNKGLTIGGQLLLVGATVVILIFLLGIFVFVSINKIESINSSYKQIMQIKESIDQMSASENNFLIKDAITEDFYQDENVESVVTFRGYANQLNSLIDELSERSTKYNIIDQAEIDSLEYFANGFEQMFDSLLVLSKIKGYKDYGLIGEMREAAHQLEDKTLNLGYNSLCIKVLQLRRHEKDYFLRKDPTYINRFDNQAIEFRTQVDTLLLNPEEKDNLYSLLDTYQVILKKTLLLDNKIGHTNSGGIIAKLNEYRNLINQENESMVQVFSEFQEQETKKIETRFAIFLWLTIILLSILLFRIRKNISVPFNNIKKSLQSLAVGVIPKSVDEKKSSREIREITNLLNIIYKGFKNTIEFAGNLKQGIFDKPFEPLSEKDELGNALLDMKKGLEEAQEQREKQQEEDYKQSWINKGTAEFAEVLNQNFSNTEEFTYSIISKLVKYLDANQGGFFVYNNDDEYDPYLQLASAFAYDRRKYVDTRIEIGEGFVGSSVVENNVIYRTEIPKDYITITSGMGGSNPRVLLIVPLVLEDEIFGALEIASFNKFEDYQLEFIKNLSESITTTMSSVRSREKTEKLLEQTREQSEQIIQTEEEMRQNLEEMQATQEESARRETKLREELEDANKQISKLENQIKEILSSRED